ncbi:MAG: PKD domain-containing protein [Caldilineaceae bacterium]|nr:PKD domain-containing protein [Caldilineaceae bacterium]
MNDRTNRSPAKSMLLAGLGGLLLLLMIGLTARWTRQPASEENNHATEAAPSENGQSDETDASNPGGLDSPQFATSSIAQVLAGPGDGYPIIDMLPAGKSIRVTGSSSDGDWAVVALDDAGTAGWISVSAITGADPRLMPVEDAPLLPAPTRGPPLSLTAWRAEYFSNRSLQGEPVLVRADEHIDYQWEETAPAPEMPATDWSARWTLSRVLTDGLYSFELWADDGARLYIDDRLIIDGWQAGEVRTYSANINLAAGLHTIRVDYFQGKGAALIRLDASYSPGYPDWRAEYYDNLTLGEPPVLTRNERIISGEWSTEPPIPELPPSGWSARWTQSYRVKPDDYIITADVEGSLRLWLDGRLLIDDWETRKQRTISVQTGLLEAGRHSVRVEYAKSGPEGGLTLTGWKQGGEAVPPMALIQAESRGKVGQEIAFSAYDSGFISGFIPDNQASQAVWDFGDGASTRGFDTIHTYSRPDIYNVTLTITDARGMSDSVTQQIRIEDEGEEQTLFAAPAAIIDAPSQAQVGETIPFYAGNSQSSAPIVRFEWDFGDGAQANAASVQKAYATAGFYAVQLTITDDQGERSEIQHQIAVQTAQEADSAANTPTPGRTSALPTATNSVVEPTPAREDPAQTDPESPVVVTVDGVMQQPQIIDGVFTIAARINQRIRIDAGDAAASDPALTFTWQMGDDSPPLIGPVIEHVYTTAGTYEVTINVDNGVGAVNNVWQVMVGE